MSPFRATLPVFSDLDRGASSTPPRAAVSSTAAPATTPPPAMHRGVVAPLSPAERLARLEADPTLRHTGVRWLAHEAAYPGHGAEQAQEFRAADLALHAYVASSLAEFEAKLPDDSSTRYMRWLRDELATSLAEGSA